MDYLKLVCNVPNMGFALAMTNKYWILNQALINGQLKNACLCVACLRAPSLRQARRQGQWTIKKK